ncbi:H-NS histone family protein [Burkholderia vietnamiensis]|nr:H-NS histone family protein [Burkholderia vietnamiensis]RQM53618.1 H-NS histone family protein [Burkholderia vietnamiensis]
MIWLGYFWRKFHEPRPPLEFDLSVLDLQERVQKRNSKRMSTVPKYRDPATGKTWSGRGRQPAWLGNDPAAFLIQPDLPAI